MPELLPGLIVSRETLEDLKTYAAALEVWTKRINLVSRASVPYIWDRHILDSAQLWLHRPERTRDWLDLGSGGGLPGLVIAIIGREHHADFRVTLVESDSRKTVFLHRVIHDLILNATVVNKRIESQDIGTFDIVSARAFAPLPKLLGFAAPYISSGAIGLFPKGQKANSELTEARKDWHIASTAHDSLTDSNAQILKVTEVARAK